jgi:TPR repeat protein
MIHFSVVVDGIHVEGGELKMARNGHGLSISKIGDIYYSREDYFKALHWYQLGAIEGYAYSQYKLGIMCSDGKGVRVDYKLAFEWFLKAHNNGSPVATTCMGFMYDFGQGVPQDNELAFKWYMEAAVRGYNLAQYNVGACYQYGEGVKADIHHALEWYQKSAEQGFSNAKYVVLMIKKGKRVIFVKASLLCHFLKIF